jgi:hypothetical protein
MRRMTGMLAALVWSTSLAVSAARPLPEIAVHAGVPLEVALTTVTDTAVCAAGTPAPLPIRDASDPVWFASGPTAQLDMEELHAVSLAPLVNLAGGNAAVVHAGGVATALAVLLINGRGRGRCSTR